MSNPQDDEYNTPIPPGATIGYPRPSTFGPLVYNGSTASSGSSDDEYNVPIPEGAVPYTPSSQPDANGFSIGPPPSQSTQQGGSPSASEYDTPIPEGATIGQAQAPVPNALHTDPNADTFVGHAENALKDVNAVGAGIGQGVLSTINGAADLFDLPHQTLQEKQDQLAQQNRENPISNAIGYGGETLMEFLLGDEGLKSLSLGDQLAKSAAVAKTLQNSPRIMEAIKIGASLLKAGGELTPEEMQIVKQYPRIAKLVGLGAEATRAGVTQAVQTGVRTQGSLGTRASAGATAGAEMAGTSAVLGGVLKGAGGVFSKLGKGAEAAKALSEMAGNAATKEEVGQSIGSRINQAESAMHDDYETGIQDLQDRLGNASVSAQDNPLAEKAQQLLETPNPAEHPIIAQAKEAVGDRLDGKVRDLLQTIADGEVPAAEGEAEAPQPSGLLDSSGNPIQSEPVEPEPQAAPDYSIKNLVDLRQTIRKLADSYEYGDINSRALRSLINPGVDEDASAMDSTIDKLAQASGDESAVDDYRQLRSDYKNKVSLFDNPVIEKLRAGKMDDAAKDFVGVARNGSALPTAGKVGYNINTLRGIIGDDGVKQFGHQVLGTIMRDSVENGKFNPARFVSTMNKVTDQTKGNLFDANSAVSGFKQLMSDAKSAANLQYLVRAGVLTGVGKLGMLYPQGAIGAGLVSMLGLLVSEGGGIAKGRELLDYVATNPKVWKGFQKAGEIADKAGSSSVLGQVGQSANAGIGQAITGAYVPPQPKDDVYQATYGALGGKQH